MLIDDYLNYEAESEKDKLKEEDDYYIKTDCYFMADGEIKGILILRKDMIEFKTNVGLDRSNLNKLKDLDFELFDKEINQMEN